MSSIAKVECKKCKHFRRAPYEASITGCYLPKNMPQKQKVAYLDQQQIPGDHEKINIRGDCKDYEELEKKPSLWTRVFSLGA